MHHLISIFYCVFLISIVWQHILTCKMIFLWFCCSGCHARLFDDLHVANTITKRYTNVTKSFLFTKPTWEHNIYADLGKQNIAFCGSCRKHLGHLIFVESRSMDMFFKIDMDCLYKQQVQVLHENNKVQINYGPFMSSNFVFKWRSNILTLYQRIIYLILKNFHMHTYCNQSVYLYIFTHI